MRDLIERGFLIGLGALTLTREKAEKIVEDLIKRGEVRREEAKDLVDKLVEKGQEGRLALRKLIDTEVQRAISRMNLATRKDIEELTKEIESLTKKLESK